MGAELIQKKISGYRVFLDPKFAEADLKAILGCIQKPGELELSVLGGRKSVSYADLGGVGRVAIKSYTRGGIFGFLVRKTYLNLGSARPRAEFEIMCSARDLGVNIPEPVGFVLRGLLFYRGWLISKEVEQKHTLAELSLQNEDAAREVMQELVRQINILIENGIYHIDLHPGNVLVDASNKVFILDFDKAYYAKSARWALRDRYIFRWRRAQIKHRLPEILTEMMCLGLRTNES